MRKRPPSDASLRLTAGIDPPTREVLLAELAVLREQVRNVGTDVSEIKESLSKDNIPARLAVVENDQKRAERLTYGLIVAVGGALAAWAMTHFTVK